MRLLRIASRHQWVLGASLLAAALGCGGGESQLVEGPTIGPATIVLSLASPATVTSVGETRTIHADVYDQRGRLLTDVTRTWSSSDRSVLTVNPVGADAAVTTVANGTATLRVTVTDRGGVKRDSLTFVVRQVPAIVDLTPRAVPVLVGASAPLAVVLRDAHGNAMAPAIAPAVSFRSTDASVAAVTGAGVVTGVAPGSAKVIAELSEGGWLRADTTDVTVTVPPHEPASVVVTPASGAGVALTAFGETLALTATVLDRDGAEIPDAVVTWSSSATGVATVVPATPTGHGALVFAAGNGSATITARAGSVQDTRTTTVQQALFRLLLSPRSLSTRTLGEQQPLGFVYVDARTNPLTNFVGPTPSFRSINPAVATVHPTTGLVTMIAPGETSVIGEATVPGLGFYADTARVVVSLNPPSALIITMTNSRFVPSLASVAVGATVSWVNVDGIPHNVVFDNPPTVVGNIPDFVAGAPSIVFTVAGSYPYHCTIHPGMSGFVIVQ